MSPAAAILLSTYLSGSREVMGVRDGNIAYFHRQNSGLEKWVEDKECKDGENTVKKNICQQNPLLKFHPMWLVKQPRGIEMAHAWMNL